MRRSRAAAGSHRGSSLPTSLPVGVRGPDEVAHRCDAVPGAPRGELGLHPDARRGDLPRWRSRPGAASAPASSMRTAPDPSLTPPTPTMPQSGKAARQSKTARRATLWSASPESPPPPAPSTGARRSVSIARPRSVLVSVRASAPAFKAASATEMSSEVFGESLAQRGRPHAAAAATASPVADRRVGEHAAAVLEVRAAHVHLDSHHAGRGLGQQRPRHPRSPRPGGPRCSPRRGRRRTRGPAIRP